MNKKSKQSCGLAKRIGLFFVCFAMVLTSVNLPIFAEQAFADEEPTEASLEFLGVDYGWDTSADGVIYAVTSHEDPSSMVITTGAAVENYNVKIVREGSLATSDAAVKIYLKDAEIPIETAEGASVFYGKNCDIDVTLEGGRNVLGTYTADPNGKGYDYTFRGDYSGTVSVHGTGDFVAKTGYIASMYKNLYIDITGDFLQDCPNNGTTSISTIYEDISIKANSINLLSDYNTIESPARGLRQLYATGGDIILKSKNSRRAIDFTGLGTQPCEVKAPNGRIEFNGGVGVCGSTDTVIEAKGNIKVYSTAYSGLFVGPDNLSITSQEGNIEVSGYNIMNNGNSVNFKVQAPKGNIILEAEDPYLTQKCELLAGKRAVLISKGHGNTMFVANAGNLSVKAAEFELYSNTALYFARPLGVTITNPQGGACEKVVIGTKSKIFNTVRDASLNIKAKDLCLISTAGYDVLDASGEGTNTIEGTGYILGDCKANGEPISLPATIKHFVAEDIVTITTDTAISGDDDLVIKSNGSDFGALIYDKDTKTARVVGKFTTTESGNEYNITFPEGTVFKGERESTLVIGGVAVEFSKPVDSAPASGGSSSGGSGKRHSSGGGSSSAAGNATTPKEETTPAAENQTSGNVTVEGNTVVVGASANDQSGKCEIAADVAKKVLENNAAIKIEASVNATNNGASAKVKVEIKGDEKTNITATTVLMKKQEDGTYAPVPNCVVSADGKAITAAVEAGEYIVQENKKTFNDVKEGSWYASGVDFAASRGLVVGVGAGQFAPTQALTLAQAAATLDRFGGADTTTSWNNAVDKYGKTTEAKRMNLISMAYDTYLAQGGKVAADTTVLDKYKDAARLSATEKAAVAWAVSNGIINGMSVDTLGMEGSLTRAQIGIILMRMAASL